MKCKECEDYRPFNNSAYGYCKMTMNTVSENGLCFNPSKRTNADRFRSFTDEELAEILDASLFEAPWCKENEECAEKCAVCALAWLKEEVDG